MAGMSTSTVSILVVDDEPDLRTLYELTLLREGYRVETAACLQQARALLQAQHFDVLLTDMRLPDGLGLELLQELQAQQRSERCIVMTAYGSAENAVQALRAGAFDYLTKPVDLKQFRSVVASAVQGAEGLPSLGAIAPSATPPWITPMPPGDSAVGTSAGPTAQAQAALARLVGQSEPMQRLKQHIAKVARGMAPVLIHGESGTGKELVARALHANSQRADGPLVAVNCSAIPENLLEAEFFGARKGSYTGATQHRDGFFQAAAGGSLFLDEIGELPLAMQSKLLRAIQERSVRPLGATQEEAVDVRILSATHRDLAAEVRAGRFRQDLYYRLNVIELVIPPLRERREDLPALCQALLARIAHEAGVPTPQLTPQALQQLAELPLAGNVRELENLLHRAMTLSDGHLLELSPAIPTATSTTPTPTPVAATVAVVAPPAAIPQTSTATGSPSSPCCTERELPTDLQAWLDQQERDILVRALQENGFNRTATAARLGISLRQIRYRIARLHIPTPQDGEPCTDTDDRTPP